MITDIERRARIEESIKKFCLMDDTFLTAAFDGQNELVGHVLSIILRRNDLTVTNVKTQVEHRALSGRSVKFDVKAIDEDGKVYDIEIQRDDRGAKAQRARFYSSMLDQGLLAAGQNFGEIAETFVIFITENDRFGHGLPLYHIERRVEELGEPFGDGAHIIFVNGKYRDESDPVGRLMSDFHRQDADEIGDQVVAGRVRYLKEGGGHANMCKVIEDLIRDEQTDVVKELINAGKLSVDEAAHYFNMTVDEVKKIAKKK